MARTVQPGDVVQFHDAAGIARNALVCRVYSPVQEETDPPVDLVYVVSRESANLVPRVVRDDLVYPGVSRLPDRFWTPVGLAADPERV